MKTFGMALAALLVSGSLVRADETAEYAREVTKRNEDAVVTLRLVLNAQMSMPGFGSEGNETVMETTGTVIQPDGLIVAALSEMNPMAMLEGLMGGMFSQMGMDLDTTVDSVTIIRGDRSEVTGKVVIRDADLDLAFVRPEEKPADEWTSVDLDPATKALQYDEVLVLRRLGRVANRQCAGSFVRVAAVLDKPRLFYILGGQGGSLGAPVFTRDGKGLGITAIRSIKSSGGGGGMGGLMSMFGGMAEGLENMAQVVVPAADVMESASQAPGYDDAE